MSERINPYIAGAPVTDPSMFFGRDDVFAWIVQNIGGRYSDNSLVIHGQRRVGKTSVLKQLSLRLSERYVPVFFDFQGRTHTTLDRFLWRLAREIVRTLGKQGVELERPEREPFSRDPEHFARGFLDQVRESLGERNLLLVFDEFDSLEAPTAKEMLAVDLVPYFSRMMHGAERVNFIFSIGSSGHKLEHMRAEYTDFFRPALYKKISFLDLEQGRRLIVEPVRGIMEYQPDAVDQILGMTSGHPYFTQLMCHELFALAQQTQDWTIRLDDVERILPDVIERGTVNLKFMWDYASDAERYTLAALAEMEEGGSKQDVVATLRKHKVRISEEEVGTAILNLVARDVLAGEYGFTVDLMRHWMLQNRPMERVVDELAEKHPIAVRFSQIAVEYREQGELDRALESYQSALDAAPDYIPAHLGVAEIHHERGAWPEAAAAYQRILELDDEQIQARMGLCEAMLALGDTAREAGDTAGALERYQQVLEIYAEHTEAWERLAGLYLTRAEELAGRKRWQAAGEALAQAWKYIPEEARGERQEVTGEERAAIEQELVALRQALGMMRTQLAHEQIARAGKLRDGKQFGAALTALERARTYAPELAGLEQAIEETREAEREAGLERMHAAGMRAMRAGRWRDAVSTFERLLALEPEDARVVEEIEQQLARARQQQTLAQTYTTAVRAMEEGRHRRAASLFRQLLTQEPTYRNVQQLLADTQRQRRGRWLRAAGIAVAGLIVLGALGYALSRPESPLMVALGTPTATATATPIPPTTTPTPTPIPSPTPTPTPIPLAWRRLTSSQFIRRDTVTAVVIDPSDPDVWYAGTKNAGIYKSINGGISWVPIHNGLGQAQIDTLIMDPEDPNTLYAGTSTGVYKTTDGGQSWQLANSGIDASGRGHGDIVLSPHDSQHLFYTTDGDGIYKSEDGAESWDELPLSSVIGDCGNPQRVRFSPLDPQTLLVLSGEPHDDGCGGVFRSTDDGETWTPTELATVGVYWDSMWVDNVTGDYVYVSSGSSEGFARSSDGGNTWQRSAVWGPSEMALHPDEGATAYSLRYGGEIRWTANGGQGWQEIGRVEIEDAGSIILAPHDPNTILIGGEGLFLSTDGGYGWEERSNGLGASHLELVTDPLRSSILYVENDVSGASQVYRSSDGGSTWELIDDQGNGLTFDADGQTLYRVWRGGGGDRTAIMISHDGGDTWEVSPYLPTNVTDIFDITADPTVSGKLYAAVMSSEGDPNQSYVSTDGGATWQEGTFGYDDSEESIRTDQGTLLVNALAIDPQNPDIMYAGTDSGAYVSFDGGGHWAPINDGLLSGLVVYSVVTAPDGTVYAATPLGIFTLE